MKNSIIDDLLPWELESIGTVSFFVVDDLSLVLDAAMMKTWLALNSREPLQPPRWSDKGLLPVSDVLDCHRLAAPNTLDTNARVRGVSFKIKKELW